MHPAERAFPSAAEEVRQRLALAAVAMGVLRLRFGLACVPDDEHFGAIREQGAELRLPAEEGEVLPVVDEGDLTACERGSEGQQVSDGRARHLIRDAFASEDDLYRRDEARKYCFYYNPPIRMEVI